MRYLSRDCCPLKCYDYRLGMALPLASIYGLSSGPDHFLAELKQETCKLVYLPSCLLYSGLSLSTYFSLSQVRSPGTKDLKYPAVILN